jgi:hypothetical protein
MYVPEYISDELFHFVGRRAPNDHERNFQTLLQVINSNCISSKPPEVGWGATTVTLTRGKSLESEELAVSNITCYCDIPVESLSRHTVKYGCFGLSFDRNMLARYGARPVLYIPTRSDDHLSPYGSTLLKNIEAIFEGFMRHLYEREGQEESEQRRTLCTIPGAPQEAVEALHGLLLKDLLAYIKPYNSELSVDDINYFYSEREWRRLGGLMFGMGDIRTVVVKAGFEQRLREAVPDFSGRVVSM